MWRRTGEGRTRRRAASPSTVSAAGRRQSRAACFAHVMDIHGRAGGWGRGIEWWWKGGGAVVRGCGTGGFNLVCLTGKQYVNKWKDVSGEGHEDPELITPSCCLFSRLQMHFMSIFTSSHLFISLFFYLFTCDLLRARRCTRESPAREREFRRRRSRLWLILHFLD